MSVTRPSKRRLKVSAAALGALGVIATTATVLSGGGASTPSSTDVELVATSTCYDMVSIGIGGRGDVPGDVKLLTTPNGTRLPAALSDQYKSPWIHNAITAPDGQVADNSYAAVYLQYPADMASYENAVTTGVTNTKTVISEISKACPQTRFSIVGYSEGADVARRAAMEIGNQQAVDGKYGIVDPSKVAGVVILADSGRLEGEGPFPGAQNPNRPDGYGIDYQKNNNVAGGAGALPGESGGFGALDGRVASFCSNGDLTCALPTSTSLIHLGANVGRQINFDALERDGLNPATGADVATVIGRIALMALDNISKQDNWLANDETFLDVLIKVSEPNYDPNAIQTPVSKSLTDDPITSDSAANLAYLPSKIFKEFVGLIGDNQNTIPVLMNDPYGLTLGPNGVGHHFDYFRDADPANGKPLSSSDYAAAWLTQLAKDARDGKAITTPVAKDKARMAVMADPVGTVNEAIALVAKPTTTTAATSTTTATSTQPTSPSATATGSAQVTPSVNAVVPTDAAAPAAPAPTDAVATTDAAASTDAAVPTTAVAPTECAVPTDGATPTAGAESSVCATTTTAVPAS